MTTIREISWDTYGDLLDHVGGELRRRGCSSLYGIPFNGWMVAVPISKRYGIPLKIELLSDWIVDDICDTGRTLCERKTAPERTAVLIYKANENFRPIVFGMEVPSSEWVRWPWEDPNETPNR